MKNEYCGGIVSDPGIYVDSSPDKVVITWEVTKYGDNTDSIKFQVVLYPNGDIRINIDDATNFADFSPTLGISKGDGVNYIDITAEKGTNKSWIFSLSGSSYTKTAVEYQWTPRVLIHDIKFTTYRKISEGGKVEITFPSGINLSGVNPASDVRIFGLEGNVEVSGQIVRVKLTAGALAACLSNS